MYQFLDSIAKKFSRLLTLAILFLSPFPYLQAQNFSLEFGCGDNVSIDVLGAGAIDSTTVTIINSDLERLDSTLVEIAVKGDSANFETITITTSIGETKMVEFDEVVENQGSGEEAAIYRAFVQPASSITVTNPSSASLSEEEWQSVTLFNIRRNVDCVGGSASLAGILLYHDCDSLFFDLEQTTNAKDIRIIAPLSEYGDGLFGQFVEAWVAVDVIHNGTPLPGFSSLEQLDLDNSLDPYLQIFDKTISGVPGDADTVMVGFISPGPPNGCLNGLGDSFVVGSVAVSAGCDPGVCCRIEADCIQDIVGDCSSILPPIPPSLQDTVMGTDSIDFVNLGGVIKVALCDSFHIRASDEIVPSNCGPNSFNVDRTFQFYSQLGVIQLTCTISVQDFILPVELSHFDVKKMGNSEALLRWTTNQESNSESFEVERSENGKWFKKIDHVSANHQSNTPIQYEFLDRSPRPGKNYYRLKIIDHDGSYSYSEIRSIEFNTDLTRYDIYPNPTSNELHVRPIGESEQNVEIYLFNAHGKQVYFSHLVDGQPIDLAEFRAGFYLIQLRGPNGEILATEKLIKSGK